MTQSIRPDVDAVLGEAVALQGRERTVVADDVRDRVVLARPEGVGRVGTTGAADHRFVQPWSAGSTRANLRPAARC
jgi:hypothetical protein